MSGFFNYDNPILRFIGKLGDVIVLNILWVICSIPIVTIGASTTAVYYVTLKLVRDEDGHTVRLFFKSFRENFKQSTLIWLIVMAVGGIIGFDLYLFTVVLTVTNAFRVLILSAFIGFGIVYLSVVTYLFPLQSRFYNTVRTTFKNAFFMTFRYLPRTAAMVIVDGAIAFLMFTYLPQLIMFGFPLAAFFNSYLLHAIFERYTPEKTREDHEMRPLFSDEVEQN